MGVKVEFDQVIKDMTLAQKQKIFPNFNNNDAQFIKVLESGVCKDSVSVNYDVNFAIVAAETAKLKEIIAIAGALVDEQNIIINKKNITAAANDLVDLIFEEKLESDLQEFKFTVEPCALNGGSANGQCFQVRMDVSLATIVTDFEDKTDDELAEMLATLEAGTSRPKKGFVKDKKKRKGLNNHTLTITSDIFAVNRKFQVRGELIENAITDGELGEDSVSGVRVTNVKFTVFAVPCPTPVGDGTGQGDGDGQGNGDDKDDDKNDGQDAAGDKVSRLDIESIEEIGPKLAANLRDSGITTLGDLSNAGNVKIKKISNERLNQFKTMAALMIQFPDQIDGNGAELITKGLGLTSVDGFTDLARSTSLSAVINAAEGVKLPSNFDTEGFADFLRSV